MPFCSASKQVCLNLSLALLLCPAASLNLRGADWPTFGHDPQRSGWAFEEDELSPKNAGDLELKWKTQLKNEPKSLTALTAPLVAEKVVTPKGVKTVVYVAGSDNHFFAIDAADGSEIWSRDFENHVLPKDQGMWLCPNGLNATPVIDRAHNLGYAIAVDGKLWGLDLGDGSTKMGPVQFVPPFSKNWSLNLVDGVIYTAISQGCGGAISGIYAMDIRDPDRPAAQDLLFSKGFGAGIWGRGGAIAGLNGRIYAAAGDGPFDAATREYGSAIVAASPGKLKVLDYYAPVDFAEITKYDLDMGAASPVWFSDKDYNLLSFGGKQGTLYLLNADSLGDRDHQTPLYRHELCNEERAFEQKGIWGGLATWRDESAQRWVYVPILGPLSSKAPAFPAANGPTPHGSIAAFKVITDAATKKPTLEPAWISGDFDVPEPPVAANGVLFDLSTGENTQQTLGEAVIYHGQKTLTDTERAQHTHNAVLYALDAKTGKILYQSGDAMMTWVHFSGLAVANGHIYAVDHDSRVYCFGLKSK
jgi:outer membrane protein assembly factor BamB